MELKTNKEYQAHLFEIEMANKKKADRGADSHIHGADRTESASGEAI